MRRSHTTSSSRAVTPLPRTPGEGKGEGSARTRGTRLMFANMRRVPRVRADPSPLPSPGVRGKGVTARELLVVWLLLISSLLVQLLGTNQLDLFRHGLWLDETITWLITNDASFGHAIAAICGGVDANPPTIYALLWPVARVVGGLNEAGLHVVSFLS